MRPLALLPMLFLLAACPASKKDDAQGNPNNVEDVAPIGSDDQARAGSPNAVPPAAQGNVAVPTPSPTHDPSSVVRSPNMKVRVGR